MNYALQARWIVPVDRPPISGGVVSVADDRIVAVGEKLSGQPPIDLGDVALLPGFVNAHTHLEFSSLNRPLGKPGMSFADWIGEVVAHRRGMAEQYFDRPEELSLLREAAISQGLAESQKAAVVALGEISSGDFPEACLDPTRRQPNCTVFRELLGLAPERLPALLEGATDYLRRPIAGFHRGLSPHAPYTVGPELLRAACSLSAEYHSLLAIHLAESREELELLRNHTGPLVERLIKLNAWFPSALPRGLRPLDYLETLQNAHRALIIHGNYLVKDEIEFVATRREMMSVVYCPRTHAYFGHETYPLAQMFSAGARVAVGTDSRASNPDLSVLSELRHIASHHRQIAPANILAMGTLAAAEALGIDADYGSISVGKRAAFAVVPIVERRYDPVEQVLHTDMPAFPYPPTTAAGSP